MFFCPFCEKNLKNNNAYTQHTIRCALNPSRIKSKGLEEYVKKIKSGEIIKKNINQWSKPGYVISEETRKKIVENNRKRIWTDEQRKKHSESMKRAVKNNPESYTSSNRGRTKQIIFENIKFQGAWELDFYKWCKMYDIKCERYNGIGFKYEWNGIRTYFPDFYLPEYDHYVEVKGFKTERDEAKWNQFTQKLLIVNKQSIIDIRKNIYKLPFMGL